MTASAVRLGIGFGLQGDFMYRQTKLALVAGILIGLGATGVASAADMALKAAPVAAPLYNWTGCYIGGNVGGGWTRVDTIAGIARSGRSPLPRTTVVKMTAALSVAVRPAATSRLTTWCSAWSGTFDFGGVKGSHALTDFPTFSETNNLKASTRHGAGSAICGRRHFLAT